MSQIKPPPEPGTLFAPVVEMSLDLDSHVNRDSALGLPLAPIADPRVDPTQYERLGRQQRAILDRLRQGPATNTELVQIAQRFGARVKELRDAGWEIGTDVHIPGSGVVTYRLLRDLGGGQ